MLFAMKPATQEIEPSLQRRQILSAGGLILGGLFVPKAILAAPSIINPKKFEKALTLSNIHTGETFDGPFWADGKFINEQMSAINHFMRDHRYNKVKEINPRLIDLLHTLQDSFGSKISEYHVVCGYRSEETNNYLRSKSNGGVAKNSKHLLGDAVDVRTPKLDLAEFVRAARALKKGGVGGYRRDNFVHVDIRETPANWGAVN